MNLSTVLKWLLAVAGVGVVVALGAGPGWAQGGIAVTGADSTRTLTPAASSALNGVLSSVGPRARTAFAQSQRLVTLTNVPAPLGAALNVVGPRARTAFAQSQRLVTLTNVPAPLGAVLSAVGPRLRFTFAQSSRSLGLSYPNAFIVDTAPPVVSGLGAVSINAGQGATITWTTDEFATSIVLWGTQSGNLNQTVSSALYNKTHSLTLTGLTPNGTYYYKVRSVDLKGNMAESAQGSFVATQTRYVYLPHLRR